MIIKSKTRSVPSFRQLLTYMLTEGKPSFVLTKNLIGTSIDDWADCFRTNERKRRKKAKNSVVLYHEICSLSDVDNGKITDDILKGIAEQYIQQRYTQAMILAVGHRDKDHAHFHVCMSGVELGTGRAASLSTSEFQDFKLEMEQYQREHYPELKTVEHDRGVPYLEPGTTKAKLRELLEVLEPEDWEEHGIEAYTYRNKVKGVWFGGRKYRFKSLGLDERVIERELGTGR